MLLEKEIRELLPRVISQQELSQLLKLIETVNHGSVTLIIQDGKVIQFERNEKFRLK